MNYTNILPTSENLERTFLEDSVGRNQALKRFIETINHINQNCSLALNGEWGSGKTFFIKQAIMILNEYNGFLTNTKKNLQIRKTFEAIDKNKPVNIEPQLCVYYDAWKNDNDDDPILSLVFSILQSVDCVNPFSQNNSVIQKTAALLECFAGKNILSAIEILKSSDALSSIRQQKEIHDIVSDFLGSIFLEKGQRLIIFIDELDRCKPAFAVKLLERIKHYFLDDRITFIFSINKVELQHTIKKYYGDSFNGFRYLDRFFDVYIELPKLDIDKYYAELVFFANENTLSNVVDGVINYFDMNARDIRLYIKMVFSAVGKILDNNNRLFKSTAELYLNIFFAPIMIGIKQKDYSLFHDFISGTNYSPLIELSKCLEPHFYYSMYEAFSNSIVLNENQKNSPEEILKSIYYFLFVDKNSSSNNYLLYSLLKSISGLSMNTDFSIYEEEE